MPGPAAGAATRAYKVRARELVGRTPAKNEDRCAAVGITAWLASEQGCELWGPA